MSTQPETQSEKMYDVAVIGGGPGGAAVATLLAQNGRSCLVVERAEFPRYHVGESLVPHTNGTLERLGLLPKLEGSPFPEKHSVRFISPDGREATPFYFSETIEGDRSRTWQVDRAAFDRMMLDHAGEHGVDVRSGASVEKVLFEGERATGLSIKSGDGDAETVRAKVVVDASGRATVIGRQLGLRSVVPDLDKASLWGYFRGGKRQTGIDAGETTMLLIPGSGWFWYIPLPDDMVSVGIVADPDRLFGDGTPEEIFEREIAQCPALAERLADAQRVGTVRGLKQLAYLNRRTSGDGWVMIGDARAFLDPVYSSGLFLALGSAELAADCIEDALASGDTSAARLGAFETALWDGVETVSRLIHAFYDPDFSFTKFIRRFPEQRHSLIDCLVGDVVKDMSPFRDALETMTPPPTPLTSLLS